MKQNKELLIYDTQDRCVEFTGIFSTEYAGERRPGYNIFHINGKMVEIILIKDLPSKFLKVVAKLIHDNMSNGFLQRMARDKLDDINEKEKEIRIMEGLDAGSTLFTRGGYGYTICHEPIVDTSYFFGRKYFTIIAEEIQTKSVNKSEIEVLRSKAGDLKKMVADYIDNNIVDDATKAMVEYQEEIMENEINYDNPNFELIKKTMMVITKLLGIIVDGLQLWSFFK